LEVDPWPSRWVFPTEVQPSKIDELNAVSRSEADTGEWVYDNGGFDLGVTRIRIVLQGRDQSVIITGARARIRERVVPPTGTMLFHSPEGDEENIDDHMDLDEAWPSSDHFVNHGVSIAPGESVTIDLTVSATKSAVVWDLVFDVVVQGERREVVVDRRIGSPFRTAGFADMRSHGADSGMPIPYGSYSSVYWFDIDSPPYGYRLCKRCFDGSDSGTLTSN